MAFIRRTLFIVTTVLSIFSLLVMVLFSHKSTNMKPMSWTQQSGEMVLKLEEPERAVQIPPENNLNTQSYSEADSDVPDLALHVSRAQEMLRKVKVACFITTQISALKTKLVAVNNTWVPRIDKIFYMVTVNETSKISFPNMLPVNITNDRQHLTEKTVYAFKYLYNNHLNDFDWFLKADDDSYVIVENLKYMLSHYNSSEPVYLGHHFKHYSVNGYMSGGGTYVLSRAALKLLVENGYNVPGRCRQQGGAEDIETGRCVTKSGGLVYSSLDNKKRETFHPLNIYGYVLGPLPRWVKGYARNEAKTGKDCCSQLTISFHYTGPNLMAILDVLLYRTSVYGRQLDYKRLQNLFSAKTVPPPPPEVRVMPYFHETRADYENITEWKLKNNTVL